MPETTVTKVRNLAENRIKEFTEKFIWTFIFLVLLILVLWLFLRKK